MADDQAPARWVSPPKAPITIGRPAHGPGHGVEHPRQAPGAGSNAALHLAAVKAGTTAAPTGLDAVALATLEELLLWYRRAVSKPTKSVPVPPYPGQTEAVAGNPNRIGLIIRVPTTALNPVYWSDNAAVSPNDSDGSAAGVPIFPGEAMVFGPEDALCATYLTTTVAGPTIFVRIGEQIAASPGVS